MLFSFRLKIILEYASNGHLDLLLTLRSLHSTHAVLLY